MFESSGNKTIYNILQVFTKARSYNNNPRGRNSGNKVLVMAKVRLDSKSGNSQGWKNNFSGDMNE